MPHCSPRWTLITKVVLVGAAFVIVTHRDRHEATGVGSLASDARGAVQRAVSAAASGSPLLHDAMDDAVRLLLREFAGTTSTQLAPVEASLSMPAGAAVRQAPALVPVPAPIPVVVPAPLPVPVIERPGLSSPPGPAKATIDRDAILPHPTDASMQTLLRGDARLLGLHARAKQLRFYVYAPPRAADWCAANLTARFARCQTFQWSGDWELIQQLRHSEYSTADGDAADYYVVPFLSKCYYNFVAGYRLRAMDAVLQRVLAFLQRSPWWRGHPERHLFFFMSGVGAGIIPSWRQPLSRAIFIVAEGDRQADYFREGHDIIVPGKISTPHRDHQLPAGKRRLLAVFRGSLDATLRDAEGGRVRKKNRLRRWLSRELEPAGRSVIFSGRKSKKYVDEMDHSRYCIIPRGNTPWTRRFFDAVVRGCIPAVLSDPITFPYERFIDYRALTIKLPEQWGGRLLSELRSVNISAAERLQRGLEAYWPAFLYAKGLAFEMLLLELAARKHGFFRAWPTATPNSDHDFWSPAHGGSFRLPSSRKVGPSWGAGAVAH